MDAVRADEDVPRRPASVLEESGGACGVLLDPDALGAEVQVLGSDRANEECLQVSAADGIDWGAEFALQVSNGHLGQGGAVVRPGHDAAEPLPNLLQLLAEAEGHQDLD